MSSVGNYAKAKVYTDGRKEGGKYCMHLCVMHLTLVCSVTVVLPNRLPFPYRHLRHTFTRPLRCVWKFHTAQHRRQYISTKTSARSTRLGGNLYLIYIIAAFPLSSTRTNTNWQTDAPILNL